MDFNIISWVFNGLMGLAVYLLKGVYNDVKEQLKNHQDEINHIKDNYLKKDDFKEFKDELWRRLDKIDHSVETIRDKQ